MVQLITPLQDQLRMGNKLRVIDDNDRERGPETKMFTDADGRSTESTLSGILLQMVGLASV